jgi:hypothetical protein
MSSFSRARTKAIYRIGPHNFNALSLLICGMLGDWWGDKIKGQSGNSVRFNIEQSISNSAYIHHVTRLFYNWGYCSQVIPKFVKKTESREKDERLNILAERYNYRLSLFTFSNLNWIYDSFYEEIDGKVIKRVPVWIEEFITPIGLAHWLMHDGSGMKNQGISIATNSFTKEECQFLVNILNKKYKLKCSVVKTGVINQWKISIWKEKRIYEYFGFCC